MVKLLVRASKQVPAFLFALVSLVFAPTVAQAALTKCAMIRPTGLGNADIDGKVLDVVAKSLRRAPDTIDTSRALKDLDDGSEMARVREYGIVSQIGIELGFDGYKVFRLAAPTVAGKPSVGGMSVRDMQAVARTTYSAGTDAPLPAAIADVAYPMTSLYEVATPRPAAGWTLTACQFDKVAFRKNSAVGHFTRSATATYVHRAVFTSDAAMARELREGTRELGPELVVTSVVVRAESNSPGHCHVLDLAGTLRQAPYRMRLRACYYSRFGAGSTEGSSVGFTQAGTIDEAEFDAAADSFFAGVVEHVGG